MKRFLFLLLPLAACGQVADEPQLRSLDIPVAPIPTTAPPSSTSTTTTAVPLSPLSDVTTTTTIVYVADVVPTPEPVATEPPAEPEPVAPVTEPEPVAEPVATEPPVTEPEPVAAPAVVAAEHLTFVLTSEVECGDGLYSVHFTATPTNPSGGTYMVTPLFGASRGPFPDSEPFLHTVGPMTDSPVSLGTFSYYLHPPEDPYNPRDWYALSVPAPGCS